MSSQQLIERLCVATPNYAHRLERSTTKISVLELPFYRDFELVVASSAWPDKRHGLRYLVSKQQVVFLDGLAETIYMVNALGHVALDGADIPAYVRFFFQNTGDGKFVVVEREDELHRMKNDLQFPWLAARIELLRSSVHPMQITPITNEAYQIVVTGLWEKILLQLSINVTPSGHIQPIEQEPLWYEED